MRSCKGRTLGEGCCVLLTSATIFVMTTIVKREDRRIRNFLLSRGVKDRAEDEPNAEREPFPDREVAGEDRKKFH